MKVAPYIVTLALLVSFCGTAHAVCPCDIIVSMGQSNNNYGAPLNRSIDLAGPHNYQYKLDGTIAVADEPLDSLERVKTVGHSVAFARDYYIPNRLVAGRDVLHVLTTQGGTGFSNGYWNPGNSLYEMALARVNAAMALNPRNALIVVLWHGGEADVMHGGLDTIPSAFRKMITDFRARAIGGTKVPIILGGLVPGWVAKLAPYQQANANNLANMCRYIQYCGFASSYVPTPLAPSNLPNGIHFSAASQRGYVNGLTAGDSLAYRYWLAFRSLSSHRD